jgi:hypothetical protein
VISAKFYKQWEFFRQTDPVDLGVPASLDSSRKAGGLAASMA